MSEDSEQMRRTERIEIALEVEYRSAGAFLVAYSNNLSKGGLFIETTKPLPEGTHIGLRLRAPDATAIEVEGVVAWTRAQAGPDGQPPGMGIEFETPDARYGSVVDNIVSRFQGLRILLATGEPAPRAILQRYLRSILACEIMEVNLAAAIALPSGHIDLAVVDLDSSGSKGDDVLRLLRADETSSAIPVIVLAHHDRDRRRADTLGADETVTNPPAFPDLQAAVIRALARPSAVRR